MSRGSEILDSIPAYARQDDECDRDPNIPDGYDVWTISRCVGECEKCRHQEGILLRCPECGGEVSDSLIHICQCGAIIYTCVYKRGTFITTIAIPSPALRLIENKEETI